MQDSVRNEPAIRGRFGYVSAYDPARHMARIKFPDKSGLISAWLPVAVPNALRNKDECHLDVDEHVFCLMLGNGLEMGIVMCSIYDDDNPPIEGDADERRVRFGDGTVVSYDREEHSLSVDIPERGGAASVTVAGEGGSVTVSARGEGGTVTVAAERIVLRGAVDCPGCRR